MGVVGLRPRLRRVYDPPFQLTSGKRPDKVRVRDACYALRKARLAQLLLGWWGSPIEKQLSNIVGIVFRELQQRVP